MLGNLSDLKIAVSGTSGIGKSTLAAGLAESLGLPLIEEGYDGKITRRKNKPIELWEKEYYVVLKEKNNLEKQYGAFVADRCPLDLLVGWFNNALYMKYSQEQTQRFLSACMTLARRYDFIIIPPWNSIPFNVTEPGRDRVRRNDNPFALLRSQATMVGFAHIFLDRRKLIEMPAAVKSMDHRISYLRDEMERRLARRRA